MVQSTVPLRDPRLDRMLSVLSGADAPLSAGETRELLELAGTHNVKAQLATRLGLRDVQQETTHRNAQRLRDFAAAAAALQSRGIPVIALKGMHLMPLVYRNLAARAMGDLDLLVPPKRLAEAGEAMREIGYEAWKPYVVADGDVPYPAQHLPPFVQRGRSRIEVHWHLVHTLVPIELNVEELWSRAVPARIGGVDVHVLSNEDLLLHLAVHATYSHRCMISVRACCDLAEVVRALPLQWDAVVERARRWKAAGGTYLVLRLTRELMAAPVPDDVLAALRPIDFDERLLQFALRGEQRTFSALRLRKASGALGKLRMLRELFLVDRALLADRHRMSPKNPLVYGLYVLRAASVLKRWRQFTAMHHRHGLADEALVMDRFLYGRPE